MLRDFILRLTYIIVDIIISMEIEWSKACAERLEYHYLLLL